MSDWLVAVLVLAGSYLTGGVPFAYTLGRVAFHTDIRKHGSGNVGATNVYRTFGALPGLAVLLLDMAKGFVPVAIAALVSPEGWRDWLMVGASLTAVLGHSFTPFLGLSGGKGVATAAGALLRLTPLSVAALAGVFLVVAIPSGLISLGSVVVAVLYPVSVLLFYGQRPVLLAFSVVAAALVLWRHSANITRLLRGEEKRLRPGRWHRKRTEKGDG